jgi:hypothetical protein
MVPEHVKVVCATMKYTSVDTDDTAMNSAQHYTKLSIRPLCTNDMIHKTLAAHMHASVRVSSALSI